MSKQKNEKQNQKKRSTVPVTLLFLTALAFVLSTGAVSLARYTKEHRREGTAVAQPFYFTGDALAEGETVPYTQLPAPAGDNVEFSVTLFNYVDSLRCSEREICYTYVVFSAAGEELERADAEKTLPGGSRESETLSFSFEKSCFESGAVLVEVTTSSPYQTTLRGRFGLEEAVTSAVEVTVSEEGDAVILELTGLTDAVQVSWPDTLTPDPGCAWFSTLSAEAESIRLEPSADTKRLALTFLKNDPALTYTGQDFTITG